MRVWLTPQLENDILLYAVVETLLKEGELSSEQQSSKETFGGGSSSNDEQFKMYYKQFWWKLVNLIEALW